MHEEFSTSYEFHDEENLLIGLENVLHTNQEWMISLKKNFLLQKSGFNLVVINNYVFSERFHCIHFSIINFLYQENFTERSSTNNALNFEIFELTLFISSFSLEHSIGSSVFNFHTKLINFIEWIIWLCIRLAAICFCLQMCWLNSLFINVFFFKSELLIWANFDSFFDILFRGCVISNPVWDTENREIYVILFIVDILKCLEYLLSKIRFELVIVFTLNVDDEL